MHGPGRLQRLAAHGRAEDLGARSLCCCRVDNSRLEATVRKSRHLALSLFFLVASAALAASGCAGTADADDVAVSDDPAAASDGMVHRTIVQFAPDGTLQPIYETVTVAQQQAEQAARAAFLEASRNGLIQSQALPSLHVDGGCAGASLWLFDQANLAGNELCLFKAATDDMAWLDLGTLCRGSFCLATWANAVRSLWAGSDPGSLQSCTSTLCFTTPFLNFTAFQRINSVAAGSPHPLNWGFLFTP